jgi:hypothetical protein
MEDGGAYNRNARIPAGGAVLALPLLEEAVRKLAFDDWKTPVVLADYGSSHGRILTSSPPQSRYPNA